ncbi:hypothetical protein EV197_0954 [Aquimarina brevivitae]|uniref:Uncharacterized protein n=1 Tax=Aquimarina brevivitae TaxID=323412 RepID=A0A4Q7PIS7_9FLAO|nr:hypothetical protein EV197_0954 [Aquimarina brevivitae]
MLHKIIHEKFLINDNFSLIKSNTLFSTKLILSSEIAMNLFTLYYFLNKYFDVKFDLITIILIAMVTPLFIVFGLVKDDKILELDKNCQKSNKLNRSIAIIYSILSFTCLIMVLKKLEF